MTRKQKPRTGDAGLPKYVASADECCGDTSLTDRHRFAKCDAITAVLTGSYTATALGISVRTLQRQIQAGAIRAVKISPRRLVVTDDEIAGVLSGARS